MSKRRARERIGADPIHSLGAAVMLRAVDDLAARSPTIRENARKFLCSEWGQRLLAAALPAEYAAEDALKRLGLS